jgi:hypothetical protein
MNVSSSKWLLSFRFSVRFRRRIILKLILKKQHMRESTGFIWLRIGTSDGLL